MYIGQGEAAWYFEHFQRARNVGQGDDDVRGTT